MRYLLLLITILNLIVFESCETVNEKNDKNSLVNQKSTIYDGKLEHRETDRRFFCQKLEKE